jgi:hypothetical protein
MAEIILFAERQIDGFANTQGYGVPSRGFNFGEDIEAFVLEPNSEYTVLWDGEAYKTIAQDVSAALGNGAYALGNAAAFDSSFSGNNEPFIIGWSTVGIVILVVDGSTETTHTVGIVQEIEKEEQPETQYGPNDAVILSYSQTPVVYEKIPKVWLTHPDSTEEAPVLVPFSYGDAVSNVEVVPDFSSGDQLVEAVAGTLIKSAILKKPDTLVPENIAEGVDIAGIIGSLVAGGGGGNVSFAWGNLNTAAGTYTVTHGLGTVPDLVILATTSNGAYVLTTAANIVHAVGMSSAFFAKMKSLGYSSWSNAAQVVVHSPFSSTSNKLAYAAHAAIDAGTAAFITADENNIKFGATISGKTYQTPYAVKNWFAFSGLG